MNESKKQRMPNPSPAATALGLHVPSPAALVSLGLLASAVAMPAQAQTQYNTTLSWHSRIGQTFTGSVIDGVSCPAPRVTTVLKWPSRQIQWGTTAPRAYGVGPPWPAPDETVTDGLVTFTPFPIGTYGKVFDPGFAGWAGDFVALTECGNGDNVQATVSVFVHPIANDDTATTPYETPVSVSLLDNDLTCQNSYAVVLTTAPLHGTARIDAATGQLLYTPNQGFSGQDTLRYRHVPAAPDAWPHCVGGSLENALVTITVEGLPPPPPPPAPEPQITAVPTLEPVALGGLGALVGLFGLAARGRQRRKDQRPE
ncbi:MAG: IPTL-CTERM sorting domain-containing protein [Burkholderiales bacterium]|nr:IPTL-CTERM sorting domain-containing protein [Burkholderiales bacterium]MBK8666463.1 IPTL-CTERM sorting domain-containing protein [Burkholderiales bacterium]